MLEYQSVKTINLTLVIAVIYTGIGLIVIGEAAIAPLLPFEAKQRGIGESLIGIIMGVHPIFNVVLTIWLTKHLNKFSRKNIMGLGNAMQVLGYVAMALITYIPEDPTGHKIEFIALALVGRILSGVGVLLFQVPCYSLIAILYRDKAEMKISLLNMCYGFGLVLGSGQESLLYKISGYPVTFLVPAGYVLVLLPLVLIILPSNEQLQQYGDQNNPQNEEQRAEVSTTPSYQVVEVKPKEQISYRKMGKSFRLILIFNQIIWIGISLLYLQPTYSLYLQNNIHISEEDAAYFFAMELLTYTLMNPIVAIMLKHKLFSRRVSMLIGIFGVAISLFFLPPCEFTGLPHPTIVQQLLVRALTGIFTSFMFIPCVPVFIEILTDVFPNVSEDLIGDAASGLLMTSWNGAAMLGPILGGLMVEQLNFIETSLIIGIVLLFLALVYLYTFFFMYKENNEGSKILKSEQAALLLKIQQNPSNYTNQSEK